MGFWSSVWGGIKKAASCVKSAVKTVAKGVGNVVKKVYSGAKKVYDQVTGNTAKEISEKAKRLYDDGYRRYSAKKTEYEQYCKNVELAVNEKLKRINTHKQYIIEVLLAKLQKLLSKIKYEKRYAMEKVGFKPVAFRNISARDDLISIDFEKDPITSRLKALVSLGFWANKQANKSLDRVTEQVAALDDAIIRMDAEVKRWNLLQKAMDNTAKFLGEMVEIYEEVLLKAESCANLLRLKCLQFTHKVSEQYCKLEALPKADKELLFALFNLSTILFTVAQTNILSDSSEKQINEYNQNLQNQKTEYEKMYQLKVA